MNYDLQAIFSVIRLVLAFLFVFGFLTPLFFEYVGKRKGIDRIVFSWVGLGGLIIIAVFILVNLHIYDFISILFFLLMIPFLIHFFKKKWEGNSINDIFNMGENRLIAKHVFFIETIKELTFKQIKERIFKKRSGKSIKWYSVTAIVIATIGSVLRLIPSIQNSSPFSRVWYFELEAVKGLSLQQYFEGYPAPRGMHSIINIFSSITQVSPEMILHVIGALISFFLTIIIFWILRDIMRKKHQSAAIFGALIYAVFPTLFLPVSMELESELSSLSLALCFALPTMVFFLRNIRSGGKIPWFYIFMGIAATGLSDIFVLLMVLLPFLLIGILTLPKSGFIKNFGKISLYLTLVFIATLSPYIIYCLLQGIDLTTFFQDQLFNTQVFSFAPNLLKPIEELSLIYGAVGVLLLVSFLVRNIIQKNERLSDEIVFIGLLVLISYVYTPFFEYNYILIDPDQLNAFYGLLISILGGLSMYAVLIFLEWSVDAFKKITPYLAPASVAVLAISFFMVQGGIEKSRLLPQTQPNDFFDAYYGIINERIPYTYATVGPELDRGLAKNRHYFMNYQFFLNNYGAIDSLYQQYLTVSPTQVAEEQVVPPASIFLFLEKPPYDSIQQGILYDAQGIMRDLEQWITAYRELEGREIRVYHETEEAIIYEIVNRDDESTITGVLKNIYSTEEGRAARLFK